LKTLGTLWTLRKGEEQAMGALTCPNQRRETFFSLFRIIKYSNDVGNYEYHERDPGGSSGM